jgi:hypothetical protein
MKRLLFMAIFFILLVCGINAQVQQQATVAWIKGNIPGAEDFLCVFANSIDDVTLLDYHLNGAHLRHGQEARYLGEREEVNLPPFFTREMERLNTRYMSIHTIQRRLGGESFVVYFIVQIVERVNNRYYIIADNRHEN